MLFRSIAITGLVKRFEIKDNKEQLVCEDEFENGFAKIKNKKLAGVIDKSGKIVVPVAYEDLQIKNNFFLTKNQGKLGLISSEGMVILYPEFDRIEFLSEKIASAHQHEKVLYVNVLSGKIIWKEID